MVKQRKRTVQTWFGCASEQCAGLNTKACWEALHAYLGRGEGAYTGRWEGSFIEF